MQYKRLIFFLLTISVCRSPFAYAELEVGKYARVYEGKEGIQVTLVDLKNPRQKLVMVTGMQSRIDDIVLLHEQVPNGNGTALETTVNDSKFWTITSQSSRWGGEGIILTLPEDVRKKVSLYYNKKASKEVAGALILDRYKKQLSSGEVRSVQIYDGDDVMPRTNGVFRRAVAETKAACGAGIGSKIDWSTFKNSAFKKLPIASLCRAVSDALGELCVGKPKGEYPKKISGITCKLSNSQNLVLDSHKRLIWSIPQSGELQIDQLKKKLKGIVN